MKIRSKNEKTNQNSTLVAFAQCFYIRTFLVTYKLSIIVNTLCTILRLLHEETVTIRVQFQNADCKQPSMAVVLLRGLRYLRSLGMPSGNSSSDTAGGGK